MLWAFKIIYCLIIFTSTIKPSIAHYWKNDNPNKYLGSEFSSSINNNIDDLQIIYDQKVEQLKKMFVTFCKVYITILNFIGEKEFKTIIKKNRNTIVNLIENITTDNKEKNLICKFLKIPPHSFQTWKRYQNYYCEFSLINLCFKKVPQQISRNEINVLKKFMSNKRFYHWSIASVWGLAFKQGKTSMSRGTWYRYSKILGLSKKRNQYKKKRKRISTRANIPNEIWHMDVTYYKTIDNIQYYIYTIVDNFSRKIIAYDVSTKLSANIRLESLKRAIKNEFDISIGKSNVDLIVDGGSENNNQTIHDFIKNQQVQITKKIALKDVKFSNSIIEGTYRILKSKYFQDRPILSTSINQEVDFFVNDYNNVRPHYEHKIYTPNEIFRTPSLKQIKPILEKSYKSRLKANQLTYCENNC